MDRQIVWPGAIPLETDLLNTNRYAMVAIGALASALFGATTTANGLAVAVTSPPSMGVLVSAGEVYTVENVDDSAYSSLAADTLHQTVKQGISAATTTLPVTAPTTAGYSVNYLIQAAFTEADTDPVVLPYYNSSDPTQAYSGPSNSGSAQPTARRGTVTVTAKPGVAAATGSQTTPSVDSGYIGLCVVTVPYGATTVTADMISPISSAPVVPAGGILAAIKGIAYASRAETAAGTSTTKGVTPDGLAQAVQGGSFLYAVAGGAANAITAALAPAPALLPAGSQLILKAAAGNTGATTLNLNGTGPKPIVFNGAALRSGMLQVGQLYSLIYDGAQWQLQGPSQSGVIASSLGLNGYEVYAHGRIEQWGSLITGSLANGSWTIWSQALPIAFPGAMLNATASLGNGGVGSGSAVTVMDVGTPFSGGADTVLPMAGATSISGYIQNGTTYTTKLVIRWRCIGN